MPAIFVFPAGNSAAREHLSVSVSGAIPADRVLGAFDQTHHARLRAIEQEAGGFYAWGAVPGVRNVPNWKALRPGDYVLCVYEKRYRFVAVVIEKYDSARLAKEVWGLDPDGKTWQYMYFLSKPQPID